MKRARRDSNPQPSDPKSDALSVKLQAHHVAIFITVTYKASRSCVIP